MKEGIIYKNGSIGGVVIVWQGEKMLMPAYFVERCIEKMVDCGDDRIYDRIDEVKKNQPIQITQTRSEEAKKDRLDE